MTTEIATYLKFANIQMAAEALYGKKNAPAGDKFAGPIADLKILTDGNERSSKFTATQADEFSKDWTVVEHISNPDGHSCDQRHGQCVGQHLDGQQRSQCVDGWGRQ